MASSRALQFGKHLKELRLHLCQKSAETQGICPIWSYHKESTIQEKGPERIRVTSAPYPADLLQQLPNTVYGAILRGRTQNDSEKGLGYWTENGELRWITYDELVQRCQYFGSAMLAVGAVPGKSIITVNCSNSLEFAVANYSNSFYSLISCPVSANVDRDIFAHILNQVESTTAVCGNADMVESIVSSRRNFPLLKIIISLRSLSRDLISAARGQGIDVMLLQDFMELGKKTEQAPIPPSPEDTYAILYTSGTTGMPKGVQVTHQCLMATSHGVNFQAGPMKVMPKSICFSYLPTGHIYEHIYQTTILGEGGSMTYYRGDIKGILQDMQVVRPENIPVVPRILNRIYYAAHQEAKKSSLKNMLFHLAIKQKRKLLKRGIITQSTIWDRLVFKKVRDILGGNVKNVITTSAPVSAEVLEFFRMAFGCFIAEVYGSTEASCLTSTAAYDTEGGHVGALFPGVEMKLVDVPEMDYFAKDDQGEICARSPMTFKGYYKNPEATASTIKDGWIHMGDIGRWNDRGALVVIDRKKDMFKLSQGEFIAPERIENIYSMLDTIATVFIEGHATQSYCVAIAIPDEIKLRELAASLGINPKVELNELCSTREVRRAFLKKMQKVGKENGLSSFHQAQNLHLHPVTNILESNLVTNTLKLKRFHARQVFKDTIDSMYKEGPLVDLTREYISANSEQS
ncbi:long-chain-fatty-acid--CoA ligase 5-like [Ornithodoros turicata]|uniref:long-chain-fatty-acid--CoA ligase 5-like n=1 Tax=Ornithodoros turicata TaxID=34597 RepID=UPI003139A07B